MTLSRVVRASGGQGEAVNLQRDSGGRQGEPGQGGGGGHPHRGWGLRGRGGDSLQRGHVALHQPQALNNNPDAVGTTSTNYTSYISVSYPHFK